MASQSKAFPDTTAIAQVEVHQGQNRIVNATGVEFWLHIFLLSQTLQKSVNCIGSSPVAPSGRSGDASAVNLIGGPQSTKVSAPCLIVIP